MCHEYSSSSLSSHSESEEDVSIANLKRTPKGQIEESSDEEDNIPLSEHGKEARQSTLSSQSSHDEDMDKEEEEGGNVHLH